MILKFFKIKMERRNHRGNEESFKGMKLVKFSLGNFG